jgi:hypothetical protein
VGNVSNDLTQPLGCQVSARLPNNLAVWKNPRNSKEIDLAQASGCQVAQMAMMAIWKRGIVLTIPGSSRYTAGTQIGRFFRAM